MNAVEHVGARIRQYRTRKHMTLQYLAEAIQKSVPTLSKYEAGKIAPDIGTLFEIAEVLEINIHQLTDYQPERKKDPSRKYESNFFRRTDRYYAYAYYALYKEFMVCVLDVTRNPDSEYDDVILYYGIPDVENYTAAKYVYQGILNCHDQFASMELHNSSGSRDMIYIYGRTPLWVKPVMPTLMLSISEAFGNPSAVKLLFSTEQLDLTPALKKELLLSDKTVQMNMKASNTLIP